MDMSAISGLLTSLNAAKDIAQAMVGLRDTQAFQTKLLEFQAKLLDAHNSAFAAQKERTALLKRVGELEKEVAHLKDWETEKRRYQLADVGRGVVAYALNPGMENGEPPHTICASCYQHGQKSILQPETRFPGRPKHLICHECGLDIIVSGVRDTTNTPLPTHTNMERRHR